MTRFNPLIGAGGAICLADALERNTSLTTLSIRDIGMELDGAASLTAALPHNTSLTRLDLRNNLLGEDAVLSIVESWNKDGFQVDVANFVFQRWRVG